MKAHKKDLPVLPTERTPLCPHFGVCGGCLWQHANYQTQLAAKLNMINRDFEQAGHDERVKEIIPAPEEYHYRNRMDFAVGWRGEIGFKERGSWSRYVNVLACPIMHPDCSHILKNLRMVLEETGLRPWDNKKYEGDLRYAVVRSGKNTGEVMVTLIFHDLARLDGAARQKIVSRLSPLCTTLYLGENPEITDLSLAKTLELLHGNEFLTEEANGLRYLIHPNSFFQTNTRMAEELQKQVAESVAGKNILDLYCGLGFLGIYLAKNNPTWTISGFEIDAQAIELAKRNAELNGVATQTNFTSGPAEDLSWRDIQADAIIIDPPRSGLHPRVLKTLLEKKAPTLVYVSCNFRKLIEELAQFKTIYRVETLTALDLFPQTPHIEVVARLRLTSPGAE